HRQRAQHAARRLRLRPGRPGQRQLRRRLQPPRGAGSGGGRRRLPERQAQEEAETRQRRRRVRRRCEQTEAGGQRAGAWQDAQREHGLHGAPHAHPHRARGPEALQDRDAAPGLQLHLAPSQRAAARGGLPGRTAVSLLPERPARRRGAQRAPAAAHLHFLPQQPEETAQRWREALGCCVKRRGRLLYIYKYVYFGNREFN
uniref:Uncharacterized protein n=1 Tax=Gasterosteus aculeatus TaxID=69293 RepID=G3PSR1_GASAC